MANSIFLEGLDLSKLNIKDDASLKLMMLIEGTYGIGVKASLIKYGYTEPRFYQLKKDYLKDGFNALIKQKTGPKQNAIRTEAVEKQILRLRFLNPLDSAAIIAQKLNQQGILISVRSVERTITAFGIQKKTAIN